MASPLVIPAIFRAIDQITGPMRGMSKSVSAFTSKAVEDNIKLRESLKDVGDKAFAVAKGTAIAGTAILGGLGYAANKAIEFEDRMADVAKTTGLAGKELDRYGQELLKMATKTRTSIIELQKIGEIGGQLGVAKEELLSFTDAANKFSVALSADYGGGVEEAIQSVGKIKNLFKETRDFPIADVINQAGSAINELGSVGAGTSANINDFILRIGALPDAVKPTLASTAALGTFFEEVGITSEIASRGFGDFLLGAGQNIEAFAKQMKLTQKAASSLLGSDPAAFATKFATSLNKLNSVDLAKKLKDLKIGDAGTIKVIGALSVGTERLGFLQKISSDAIAKGASLTNEYTKKNETAAAKIERLVNSLDAMSITIGQKIIPAIVKFIDKAGPIINRTIDWMNANEGLTQTIVEWTAGIGLALIAISAISTVIGIVTKAVWLSKAIIWLYTGTLALLESAAWLGVAAMGWLADAFLAVGAAILATPIGWLIAILAALVGVIYLVYSYWDELKAAFRDISFMDVIKGIGKTIFEFMVFPIRAVLSALALIPGSIGDASRAAVKEIDTIKSAMFGSTISIEDATRNNDFDQRNTPYPARVAPAYNPKAEQSDLVANKLMMAVKSSQEIIVRAAPGTEAEKGKSTGNGTGVKIESTMTPR